jgi:hypothetical protein
LITNLVEAILDRKKLKWDAFWHLFAWLLDKKEGHGMSSAIVDQLLVHTFGERFSECITHAELQLSATKDGKGKWADLAVAIPSFDNPTHLIVMDDIDRRSPGSMRKLNNLLDYQRLAKERYPSAIVRTVVLTNALDGTSLQKMRDVLGAEVTDFKILEGWTLLPVSIVGGWVKEALNASGTSNEKIRIFLTEFVEWSQSLHC